MLTPVARVVRPPPCYPCAEVRARRTLQPAASTERDTDGNPPCNGAEGDDTGRGAVVTGRVRHPGGEQRKASQKRSRPAAPTSAVATAPALRLGDHVRWSRYTGTVQRVVGDEADIRQDGRNTLWRLPVAELTQIVG